MLTHHAYLLFADGLSDASLPQEYKTPSIDVLHILRDRFSIADARELSGWAGQKPFESEKRVFIIVTEDIAVEAQNALLKLLEEPSPTALFYVIIPRTAALLPTLRSRLYELEDENEARKDNTAFIEFLHSSYGERMRLIAAKTKDKDVRWIEEVVAGVEKVASESRSEILLRGVLFVRQYVKKKGASAKMLLEELSLLLPPR